MQKFIRAVKEHQCLWNISDADYRNPDKKDMAWQNVVDQKLDIRGLKDIKSAKNEWKKLRDNHRDSLKRHKMKSTLNTWRYAKEMEFLVPHMKTREKSSGTSEQYEDETEFEINQPCSPTTMYLQPSYNSEDDDVGDSKVSVQTEITNLTRKRKAEDEEKKAVEKGCQKCEKHPIEYFFESMAQTAKSMPIYLQNRIKKGVLEIVCQAEEEMEAYKSSGPLP